MKEDLFKDLKISIEKYKEYLLDENNNPTEQDKNLFGIIMFKYGTLLASRDDYINEKLTEEEKFHVDLVVADVEAFIETVNSFC